MGEINMIQDLYNHKIILFPLGVSLPMALKTLQAHNISVVEIWDNFKDVQEYQGILVKKPHAVKDQDTIAVFCGSPRIEKELNEQVKELCSEIISYGELLAELNLTQEEQWNNNWILQEIKNWKWKQEHPDAFVIRQLTFAISDRCTLKCKDCASLMQYFQSPQDADLQQVLKDGDAILEAVDRVERLVIFGGEPFLVKELYHYVNHIINHDKIAQIEIFTNGTIIPKGENLACLQHPKVFVQIDDYGKVSKNIDGIVETFKQYNIAHEVHKYVRWADCGKIQIHHRTEEQLQQEYASCSISHCTVIRDGHLFPCTFLAGCWGLHALLPNMKVDFPIIADYKEPETLREILIDFYHKPYFKGCDLCNGSGFQQYTIPAAIQTPTPLPYQRYDD